MQTVMTVVVAFILEAFIFRIQYRMALQSSETSDVDSKYRHQLSVDISDFSVVVAMLLQYKENPYNVNTWNASRAICNLIGSAYALPHFCLIAFHFWFILL